MARGLRRYFRGFRLAGGFDGFASELGRVSGCDGLLLYGFVGPGAGVGAGVESGGKQQGQGQAKDYKGMHDFRGQGCVRLGGWDGGVCAHSVVKGARTPEHL